MEVVLHLQHQEDPWWFPNILPLNTYYFGASNFKWDTSLPDKLKCLPVITETMVNPGAFLGSHWEFMIQEVEGYVKAVEEGRAAEFIANVICWYLKCYPLSLEHNVEPSPEHLAGVDDHALDPEVVMPNEDELTFEEYKKVQLKFIED